MPIQYPYKLIASNGVHQLDPHVQMIGVAVPLSLTETCDIYLPRPEVTAALLKIVNRSKGSVTIRPQGPSKTIAAAGFHRMPTDQILVESRLSLLPLLGSDGQINGHWTVVGGNCFQMATLSLAVRQEVAQDTTAKINAVTDFDAAGAMSEDGYTPPALDYYVVDIQALAVGMTAGANVWIGFGNEFGNRFSWQSFVCIGGSSDPFAYSLKAILDPNRSYSVYIRHNDAAAREFGIISATIKRAT
jgi:hypothetical protein